MINFEPYFTQIKIQIMGKGDRRTKKGKINIGSFGNSRPKRGNAKKTEDGKKKS